MTFLDSLASVSVLSGEGIANSVVLVGELGIGSSELVGGGGGGNEGNNNDLEEFHFYF